MKEKGYVQVYTGNGKGKTTAAVGVAVRTLMMGRRVYMGQFVKSIRYNEARLDEIFPGFTIEQYGSGCWIDREATEEDRRMAQTGYEKALHAVTSGQFDLVILDELNIALYYNMISTEQALHLIRSKDTHTELIITGRYAPDALMDAADLVTEMKEIKHYYRQGVEAREGIER